MDERIASIVAAAAAACATGDEQAFLQSLAELKRQVAISPAGGSIGPRLAFGTLLPAGDAIGKAMAAGGAERALPLLAVLAGDDSPELRCIACRAVGQVGAREPEAIVALAYRLADDPSWEVREFIANALDEVMGAAQGDFVFALMQQWAHDARANVRRVPTNALMRYGRRNPERVIGLMRDLLHDDSQYVRDNVVFCLSVMGATRVQALGREQDLAKPALLLATLRGWIADEDVRARWIIARTLGRPWTRDCLGEALELLRVLAADGRKEVRRAVCSALKTMSRQRGAEVQTAVYDWERDENGNVRSTVATYLGG